jgi:hypothetical protein
MAETDKHWSRFVNRLGWAVALGCALEWVGKKLGAVAPLWAWLTASLGVLILWALTEIERHLTEPTDADALPGRFDGLAGRLEVIAGAVSSMSRTVEEVRQWQTDEPTRTQYREKERAWEIEHQDEIARLRNEVRGDHGDRAAEALLQLLRMREAAGLKGL